MKPDMKTFARNLASFRQMTWIAFGATFFLVAVGGVVRVTGSGLGCPDWPTCWGCWLPPSSQEVIPTQVSSDGRTYYEDKFGRKHALSEFDAAKMWIEYLNRLVGVAIGLLILWAFLRSLRLRKTSPRHFQGALLALLMVAFQGWLGAVVVRSELVPGIITLHMVIAMILLCLLLALARSAREKGPDGLAENQADPRPCLQARILAGAVLAQVILGTQVREGIDPFIKDAQGLPREAWLAEVGLFDHLHRPFSWLVLLLALLSWKSLRRRNADLQRAALLVVGLTLVQMALGIILAYGGLPPTAQTLHLAGSAALICLSFHIGWPARPARAKNSLTETAPTH